MIKNYWVQYRYYPSEETGWVTLSDFVTVDEDFIVSEFSDLEYWWNHESNSSCEHELLQVVKL